MIEESFGIAIVSMAKLSQLGVFAFYTSAMLGNGLETAWRYADLTNTPILLVLILLVAFAAVALIVGKMVTDLTHHIYRETVRDGAEERLLAYPLQDRSPDIDLISVVYEVVGRFRCGKFLTLTVMLFGICIILILGLNTAQIIVFPVWHSAFMILKWLQVDVEFQVNNISGVIIILGAAIVISILNKLTEKQQERVQIVAVFCKFGVIWMGGSYIVQELPDNFRWTFIPSGACILSMLWVFCYHIVIPSTANASQQTERPHIFTQQLAIATTLCYYLWFWYSSVKSPYKISENLQDYSDFGLIVFCVINAVMLIVNVQIYWKALSCILAAWVWRFDADSLAKSSPVVSFAINVLLHWPFHLLSAVLFVYNLEATLIIRGLFIFVIPLLSSGLLCAISVVYLYRNGTVECSVSAAFAICLTGIAILFIAYLLVIQIWDLIATITIGVPFTIAVAVSIAILLWRYYR